MSNELQTSAPRGSNENDITWLRRIINAIITDIKYISSLFTNKYSGEFINGDGDTVTVVNGIIVSVEPTE